MDMEPEEQTSWFFDNWVLVLLNLIFGAVTCIVIWICTRSDKEESQEECPSKIKEECSVKLTTKEEKPAKEVPSQNNKKGVIEVEEEVTVLEEAPVESGADGDHFDHHDEISMKVTTHEVVEEVNVEEVSELKHEIDDLLDHHEADGEEVETQVKVGESTGEAYVVIKQVDTEKAAVETVGEISGSTTYEIDVKTGDVSGAGTDANVFIIIYGAHADTGKIHLEESSTHKHKFEKNHVDSFTEEAPNVGKIDKIRIGHDNKGGFAGWFLSNVAVNVPSLNCKWTFTADRWLDKKEADKQLEIDIYPSLVEETYVETTYIEGKPEDLIVKDSDAVVSHAEVVNTDDDSCKVTHSFTSDIKIVSDNEMVVEEVTTTTTEEVHKTTINVGGLDDSGHVAVEAVVGHDHESQKTSQIVEDVKGIDD